MKLKTYLDKLSTAEREDFAKRCGTSFKHIQNIGYGYKTAGEDLAINIDRESGGKVRCETLRPDVDWAYLRNSKKAA
jgi:DNA-binding transcriptional regulator YdaS (Cro superfamily)